MVGPYSGKFIQDGGGPYSGKFIQDGGGIIYAKRWRHQKGQYGAGSNWYSVVNVVRLREWQRRNAECVFEM